MATSKATLESLHAMPSAPKSTASGTNWRTRLVSGARSQPQMSRPSDGDSREPTPQRRVPHNFAETPKRHTHLK
eukprot:6203901-Pleurochrysis_carterae.AAC.2